MTQAMTFGLAAGACLVVAAGAGVGQHRRTRRRDPDAVGMIDWGAVQMAAFFGAAIAGLLAFHA